MKTKTVKTITICASASHYRQVLDIEKQLKKLGFKVLIPITANIMKKNNDFDVLHYKTWYKNKRDYILKTKLIDKHFKKIIKADAILVTNFKKNGIEGYVGGNTLMEMTVAFIYKKPIFVLNNISNKLTIAEEIYGLNSIFIEGDLEIVKNQLK